MSLLIKGSKPYVQLTDTDTAHVANIKNDGTQVTVDNDVQLSKATPSIKLNDTGSGTTATISYDGTNINVDHDVKHTGTGASLLYHAGRHNRGGADPIDWSSVSRYRNASGSGTIGVSGSPATILELSVSTNYYNLLPLLVSYSISGLGTGETFTLYVTAVLDDGTEVTLYSASGLNAGGKVTIADLDFTQVGDTKQIRTIRVKAESSATSTSATLSATVVALET